MSREDSELLASILRLPQAVRAQFARAILASLDDAPEADVDAPWRTELERRVDEIVYGRAELEDADIVHARLAARLRDASR